MEMAVIQREVKRKLTIDAAKDRWHEVEGRFKLGEIYEGVVAGMQAYGVFIILKNGPKGLLHLSKLSKGKKLDSYKEGDNIRVRILAMNREERRLSLEEA